MGAGAGIAALLLLVRVLAVAHWDWSVAGHILDTFDFGSAINVAVGTLFANATLATVVTAFIAPVAVAALMRASRHRASLLAPLTTVVFCVAMLASLSYSEGAWWGPVVAVVLTIGVAMFLRSWEQGRIHSGVEWLVKRLGLTVLVGVFVLAVGVQDPWVSAERITTTDGATRTLYVLKESPSGVHVLVPGGDVEILLNSEIVKREYP